LEVVVKRFLLTDTSWLEAEVKKYFGRRGNSFDLEGGGRRREAEGGGAGWVGLPPFLLSSSLLPPPSYQHHRSFSQKSQILMLFTGTSTMREGISMVFFSAFSTA
jgi:hypothetical protein